MTDQIKGSVTRHQGVMSEKESIEAFVDGAKRAASAARELAKDTGTKEWLETANFLDAMRENGMKLANMRSMTAFETKQAIALKTGQGLII
jgi:hypothetical protein